MTNNNCFVGTARFASIAAHKGQQQSRKDDLESLGYSIVFMLRGTLPWVEVELKGGENRLTNIQNVKENIQLKDLCKGLPEEFLSFFAYVKGLNFLETPSYSKLRSLFWDLYQRRGFSYDNEFDWIRKDSGKRSYPPEFHRIRSNLEFIEPQIYPTQLKWATMTKKTETFQQVFFNTLQIEGDKESKKTLSIKVNKLKLKQHMVNNPGPPTLPTTNACSNSKLLRSSNYPLYPSLDFLSSIGREGKQENSNFLHKIIPSQDNSSKLLSPSNESRFQIHSKRSFGARFHKSTGKPKGSSLNISLDKNLPPPECMEEEPDVESKIQGLTLNLASINLLRLSPDQSQ
jgi:hypothetical protein